MKWTDGVKAMAETPAQIKALTVGVAIVAVVAVIALILAVRHAN